MTHLEVSVDDPLLVAVLDCRHYLDRRDARLLVIAGADYSVSTHFNVCVDL